MPSASGGSASTAKSCRGVLKEWPCQGVSLAGGAGEANGVESSLHLDIRQNSPADFSPARRIPSRTSRPFEQRVARSQEPRSQYRALIDNEPSVAVRHPTSRQ